MILGNRRAGENVIDRDDCFHHRFDGGSGDIETIGFFVGFVRLIYGGKHYIAMFLIDSAMAGTMLPSLSDVERLAERLVRQGAIPVVAQDDAAHVAVAAVHGMDYLVTWNFRHINNLTKMSHIEKVCQELGYRCPQICTPEHLYGGQP